MNLQQFLRSATACALAAAMLSPTALAVPAAAGGAAFAEPVSSGSVEPAAPTDSANVISAALNEVGYVESENEYSKYSEWYGLSNAFWCDMFVSWCAMKGSVPETQFPSQCSCTKHVELFTEMGQYQNSASRGGSYTPQQGDVIFFYNNLRYASGKVCNHTGLVLYVEDGYVYTIEGNALTNRLDYLYTEVTPEIDGSLDPPDRVVVNRYPLDALHIHGYGVPAYDRRTPLELEGFVDLGRHAGSAGIFQYLHDTGVMPATSEHTFSPDHGMTRGEFITLLADFFCLPDSGAEVLPFEDIPLDSPCYSAVMSARSAGLICGAEDNRFLPDIYISPEEAQTLFDRTLGYFGLDELPFAFSGGDYSYLLTPYTIRADIAKAFYVLCWQMPLSEEFDGQVFLGDEACPARSLDGVCYVPAQSLQEVFPALELAEEAAREPENELDEIIPGQELTDEPEEVQAHVWNSERVFPSELTLLYEGEVLTVNGFIYQGIPYVSLYAAAGLLSAELEYSEGEPEPLEDLPEDAPEGTSEDVSNHTVTVVRLSV